MTKTFQKIQHTNLVIRREEKLTAKIPLSLLIIFSILFLPFVLIGCLIAKFTGNQLELKHS